MSNIVAVRTNPVPGRLRLLALALATAVPLLGDAMAAQVPSGRYSLRTIDGRRLPYAEYWREGGLMYAIESGMLDFYRPDSVRSSGIVRDGTLAHAPCSVLREMRAEQQRGVSTGGVTAGSDTAMAECDDLRVEHQTVVRAFSVTGNALVLHPAPGEWRPEEIECQVHGDTIALRQPIGSTQVKGQATFRLLVYVRE